MSQESPRIAELRRRLEAEPASIAFAQLAEELRRAGGHAEAVAVCRTGLKGHPGYLSARVTLGRTLIELGELDDAQVELTTVIRSAPDNLAAIRGLAEIHQRRHDVPEALLFDFDTLLQRLGTTTPSILEPVEPLLASAAAAASAVAVRAPVPPAVPDDDRFAQIERELRQLQDRRDAERRAERSDAERQRSEQVVAQLEAWLGAIRAARQ